MGRKDLKTLLLLIEFPQGLFGSELVARSNGELTKGGIYTQLSRLVDKGFVREVEVPPTPEFQLARTRHIITANGQRAVSEFLEAMNLSAPSFAGGL